MEIVRCERVKKVYGSGGSQVTALSGINLSGGKPVDYDCGIERSDCAAGCGDTACQLQIQHRK
jgi:hypothetical protein